MTRVEALKLMCEYCKHYDICLGTGCTLRSFLEDTAEVVRCKDCDNRFYDKDRNLYYCTMYYGMGDVHDENYCSFGERREDD